MLPIPRNVPSKSSSASFQAVAFALSLLNVSFWFNLDVPVGHLCPRVYLPRCPMESPQQIGHWRPRLLRPLNILSYSLDLAFRSLLSLARQPPSWHALSTFGHHGSCSTSQWSKSRPLLRSIRETFKPFPRFLFHEAFPLGVEVQFCGFPERLLLFLRARNFSVLYVPVFGVGFQALSSWALLVPGIMQFSHGGLHVFL